eukprot:4878918-Pleurochrysis_carterae.AAC.1
MQAADARAREYSDPERLSLPTTFRRSPTAGLTPPIPAPSRADGKNAGPSRARAPAPAARLIILLDALPRRNKRARLVVQCFPLLRVKTADALKRLLLHLDVLAP